MSDISGGGRVPGQTATAERMAARARAVLTVARPGVAGNVSSHIGRWTAVVRGARGGQIGVELMDRG